MDPLHVALVVLVFGLLVVIGGLVIGLILPTHRNLVAERNAHAALRDWVTDVVAADAERQRVVAVLDAERERLESSLVEERDAHAALRLRMTGVLDADAERRRVLAELEAERTRLQDEFEGTKQSWHSAIESLRNRHDQDALELVRLQADVSRARAEWAMLDEEANLRGFGFYKPRYAFASSKQYEAKLDEIRERQKQMLKDKVAAQCAIEWTVDGSVAEGRKHTNQTLRLMLRAFNGECDAAIAKVKYNNVHVMEARIDKAAEAIDSLGVVHRCSLAPGYVALKLSELYVVHEFWEKLQAEKEEQRAIREQMREEEAARREVEKARQEAEREETRYARELAKARAEAETAFGAKQEKLLAQVAELQQRLADAQQLKERAIAQAQLTKMGHVYVISNIGSFGEHVYKIGMTRRLVPQDRVDELGDASVPFPFDVHAMIKSQDAPALESALQRAFHERRVNRVNERKEFFRVQLAEVVEVVRQHHGEVEFTWDPEAAHYRQTLAMNAGGCETSGARDADPCKNASARSGDGLQ